MITKEQKVRLSIFLVIAALLLVIILAVFIYPKLKEKGETYFINFKGTSVNGLNLGADVKYQGVKIGVVSRIVVNPEDLNSILVYVNINSDFPVKEDMRATLQYAGITGLRFIEISGGNIQAKLVPPEGEILTKKGLVEDIVGNVDSLMDAVNKLLNPKNRERFGQLMENLEESTRIISDLLQEKEQHVGNSLEKFDAAMTELIEVSENLKKFSVYLNDISQKVPLETIANDSEKLIRELSQRFSKQEMGKVLESMDRFLDTASSSMRKIENRFVDLESEFNRTLVSLRESMENISQFTRDLREDPTLFLLKRPGKKEKKAKRSKK